MLEGNFLCFSLCRLTLVLSLGTMEKSRPVSFASLVFIHGQHFLVMLHCFLYTIAYLLLENKSESHFYSTLLSKQVFMERKRSTLAKVKHLGFILQPLE